MLEVEASSDEEEFNPDKAMEQRFRSSKKTQKDIKQRFTVVGRDPKCYAGCASSFYPSRCDGQDCSGTIPS
eukprot:6755137-Pyramimonas_sp.AAC.1